MDSAQASALTKKYPEHLFPVWTFSAIIIWTGCGLSRFPDLTITEFVRVFDELFDVESSHAGLFLWDTYSALKACVYQARVGNDDKGNALNTVGHISSLYEHVNTAKRRVFGMISLFEVSAFVAVRANEEIIRGVQVMFDTDGLEGVWQKPLTELKSHTELRAKEFRDLGLAEHMADSEAACKWIGWTSDILDDLQDKVLHDQFGRRVRAHVNPLVGLEPQALGVEPDALLGQHPALCGFFKHNLYLQLEIRAMSLEEDQFTLTTMMHLYVARRSVFPNDPNMKSLFFGGLPGSVEEARKKACLAFGFKLSQFARDARSGGHVDPKMARQSWFADLRRTIQNPASIARLSRLLQLPVETTAKLAEQWSRVGHMPHTPLQLNVLMRCEFLDLHFGWFSLMGSCEDMFSKIRAKVREETGEHFEHRSELLLAILTQAEGLEGIARNMKIDVPLILRQHSSPLAQAWNIMKTAFMKETEHPFQIPGTTGSVPMKSWAGDQELLRMAQRHCGISAYPNIAVRHMQTQLYENWPAASIEMSAVRRYHHDSYLQHEAIRREAGMSG
ncbi:Uu.00g115840.m01.CDS01 [Anthostomella pinea]|uniref:Uu.00g115840.m01.CDS01 n=1 Tax=Anthostomella pinea TaxID=933095 RepID=A0AAI8VFY6_9PEZI|nr:Uu.00g115840.m01.CDS01 [Anthostomella pinea]